MSIETYKKAKQIIDNLEDLETIGGKSIEVIKKGEELFGLKFSKILIKYFEDYGYISFNGNEIFGIIDDDFLDDDEMCCVESALSEREKYNLPKEWLPISFIDDGYYAYLDFSNLNNEGEPKVIAGIYNGEKYEMVQTIAEDLGDFLLELAEETL